MMTNLDNDDAVTVQPRPKLTFNTHTQTGNGKTENQDALIAYVAQTSAFDQLDTRGSVFAVADGISSSRFGREASQIAVTGFLSDYLDTPETWSVKKSGFKVLSALNSWLVSQSRQGGRSFNKDKGYVCAFSVIIVQSRSLHIFNSGDVAVLMVHDGLVSHLTHLHRHLHDEGKVYLSAALGLDEHMRLDYLQLEAVEGATYCLLSDGVHEFITDEHLIEVVASEAIDNSAKQLCDMAVEAGSRDDASALIVHIDHLPSRSMTDISAQGMQLPPIGHLQKGAMIDGLKVIRPLSITPRSHTYLVIEDGVTEALVTENSAIQNGEFNNRNFNNSTHDNSNLDNSNAPVYVLKAPSVEKQEDSAHVESMLMEEWIARKLNHAHLMSAPNLSLPRTKCYTLSHYVAGQSLAQWMHDHPKPSLSEVRSIIAQIAIGLQALHRAEIIHRDLRPQNILIDDQGTVTIIDFGEALVAGLQPLQPLYDIPGSLQYSAPEYLLGSAGTVQSDVFSLGVLTYQMLSGHLPYGMKITNATNKKTQQQLTVRPLKEYGVQVPAWVNYAISKALAIDPKRRYEEVAEFVYELNHPSSDFKPSATVALVQRDPVRFWQGLSILLLLTVIGLVIKDYL